MTSRSSFGLSLWCTHPSLAAFAGVSPKAISSLGKDSGVSVSTQSQSRASRPMTAGDASRRQSSSGQVSNHCQAATQAPCRHYRQLCCLLRKTRCVFWAAWHVLTGARQIPACFVACCPAAAARQLAGRSRLAAVADPSVVRTFSFCTSCERWMRGPLPSGSWRKRLLATARGQKQRRGLLEKRKLHTRRQAASQPQLLRRSAAQPCSVLPHVVCPMPAQLSPIDHHSPKLIPAGSPRTCLIGQASGDMAVARLCLVSLRASLAKRHVKMTRNTAWNQPCGAETAVSWLNWMPKEADSSRLKCVTVRK